jgi:hypothetical protein
VTVIEDVKFDLVRYVKTSYMTSRVLRLALTNLEVNNVHRRSSVAPGPGVLSHPDYMYSSLGLIKNVAARSRNLVGMYSQIQILDDC